MSDIRPDVIGRTSGETTRRYHPIASLTEGLFGGLRAFLEARMAREAREAAVAQQEFQNQLAERGVAIQERQAEASEEANRLQREYNQARLDLEEALRTDASAETIDELKHRVRMLEEQLLQAGRGGGAGGQQAAFDLSQLTPDQVRLFEQISRVASAQSSVSLDALVQSGNAPYELRESAGVLEGLSQYGLGKVYEGLKSGAITDIASAIGAFRGSANEFWQLISPEGAVEEPPESEKIAPYSGLLLAGPASGYSKEVFQSQTPLGVMGVLASMLRQKQIRDARERERKERARGQQKPGQGEVVEPFGQPQR